MADSFLALADLTTINDNNLADIDVSDIFNKAPLLNSLHAVPASNGTLHKYTKETTAPTVGFRSVNDGRENSKSADTLVTVTLKILDASFAVDQALAHAYKRGKEAYIAREAMRHLRQAYFIAERQFLYGAVSPGASAGFAGLADSFPYKDSSMVIDATGSTANTGSSVWLMRTDADESHVCVVGGNDGNIEMGDSVSQRIDGATTGTYPAYYTPIQAWLGMQIGSAKSVARIANLTAQSGKGLTDALIAQAIGEFPAGEAPTMIAMNRRSLHQLQASRTATNSTGAPAPFPTEAFGIPIIVTDTIVSTEGILTATP